MRRYACEIESIEDTLDLMGCLSFEKLMAEEKLTGPLPLAGYSVQSCALP